MLSGWKGHTSPGAHRWGKLTLCYPQSLHSSLKYRTAPLFMHMVWKVIVSHRELSINISPEMSSFNYSYFL